MELHYRSTKSATRFTVLLNNMRVMGIFDWLLSVQNILMTPLEDPFTDGNTPSQMVTPLNDPFTDGNAPRRPFHRR